MVRHAILAVVVASGMAACSFPTHAGDFACQVDSDCDADRVCDQGFCVIGSRVDAGVDQDAPIVEPDGPPSDADNFAQIAMMCQAAGYTLEAGPAGYYRPVTNGKKWLDAQADCKDDVAGATHLIVLSTTAEVTYMATQLGWIGLSDRATEGTFVTVTGETGDQRPFASGQPDNGGGNENCVQMKSGGKLDDDQCGNGHRYVCECDGRESSP